MMSFSNLFSEKRITQFVVVLLCFISGIALVTYGMRVRAQESSERRVKEAAEMQKEKREDNETRELKEALEKETDPEVRAKLEARLQQRAEVRYKTDIGVAIRMKEFRGAGLDAAKWARVSMAQAIQIATSQYPGSAIRCSLYGASDDKVVYEVLIVSSPEPDSVINHVIVSALDGTILKTEKEMIRQKVKQ